MAPASFFNGLVKRQIGFDGENDDGYECIGYGCSGSSWDTWGRWVALACIIVAILLLAFAFSCFNNRRRRQRGAPPMYGTGWMPYGKPPVGHGQAYFNGNAYPQTENHPPPPPYLGNQATGTTFNSNEGYYGHHANDIELQRPEGSYMPQRGGDDVYVAPEGAPPRKN